MYRSMGPDELDYQYSCRKWSIKPVETEEVIGDFLRITTEATDEAKKVVPNLQDVRYGNGEKQKLDIYGTDLPLESAIVVFLHGGYWQALCKDDSGSIVNPLYKEGIKVIVADYDLTPQVSLRVIVQEAKDLMTHILELAEKSGSTGVWFVGHSAGAHLSSLFLHPDYLNVFPEKQRLLLKGMVLISGVYDILPLIHTHINECALLDTKEAKALSTHENFGFKNHIKVFITVGKHESPEFHRQTIEAYEKSINAGNEAGMLIMEDIDHFTIIEKLQEPNFQLTRIIISMVKNS